MKNKKGLKALASSSLVITRFHDILSQTEKELESELKRESKEPQTSIEKAQRNGQKIVKSKPVLFFIVVLNVIDCMLVLGELILDMYYVKGLLQSSQVTNQAFISDMKTRYPMELSAITINNVEPLYQNIRHAHIDWSVTTYDGITVADAMLGDMSWNDRNASLTNVSSIRSRSWKLSDDSTSTENYTNPNTSNTEHDNSTAMTSVGDTNVHNESESGHFDTYSHDDPRMPSWEVKLTHALHTTSISILVFLVIEGTFKILSFGRIFLKRRLEVFDLVIICISLLLDILFFHGVSVYDVQRFVIILSFLVPWRVIRVVNSLIIAVMDHHHFRLKLLYKQKKEVTNDNKMSKSEAKNLEQQLHIVLKLVTEAGVSEQEVLQTLAAKGVIDGDMEKQEHTNHSSFRLIRSFHFLHHNSPSLLMKSFHHEAHGGLGVTHSFPFLHSKSTYSMTSHSSSDMQMQHLENIVSVKPENVSNNAETTGSDIHEDRCQESDINVGMI